MHWQKPGGFKSVFQLQPKGLELLIWGGWDETRPTLFASPPSQHPVLPMLQPRGWHRDMAQLGMVAGGGGQRAPAGCSSSPSRAPRHAAARGTGSRMVPVPCPSSHAVTLHL